MKITDLIRKLKTAKRSKKVKVTVIPYKLMNSEAYFTLLRQDGNGCYCLPSLCVKNGETLLENVKTATFDAFNVSSEHWIVVSESECIFAVETDVSDKFCESFKYEEALDKLQSEFDKNALSLLFYKPEPL